MNKRTRSQPVACAMRTNLRPVCSHESTHNTAYTRQRAHGARYAAAGNSGATPAMSASK
jgi:hypothetical protein